MNITYMSIDVLLLNVLLVSKIAKLIDSTKVNIVLGFRVKIMTSRFEPFGAR
jgi:hypothetical protein